MAEAEHIRVFLCDDSHEMRRLVELQLGQDERFELVGSASAPESCVSEVRRSGPDVVLLDHGLPPGPQWEDFVQALRQAAPGARIVLFSGLPQPVLAREARDHGLDGFLEKGQSAAELRDGVAALAGRADTVG
ncbi:MAG TPA: response regulator [Solirubrobacteraceae bacterium]|jgi:DNA-binding NarL/FixJ family response regulator|nr:response regulator [Solirubrobacteraceae bacterium]